MYSLSCCSEMDLYGQKLYGLQNGIWCHLSYTTGSCKAYKWVKSMVLFWFESQSRGRFSMSKRWQNFHYWLNYNKKSREALFLTRFGRHQDLYKDSNTKSWTRRIFSQVSSSTCSLWGATEIIVTKLIKHRMRQTASVQCRHE